MEMSHRHSVGVVRREFIQVGFSGLLGLGLPDVSGRACSRRESTKCGTTAGQVGHPGVLDRRIEPHRLV